MSVNTTDTFPLLEFPKDAAEILVEQLDLMTLFELSLLSEKTRDFIKTHKTGQPTKICIKYPTEISNTSNFGRSYGPHNFLSVKWKFFTSRCPQGARLDAFSWRIVEGVETSVSMECDEAEIANMIKCVEREVLFRYSHLPICCPEFQRLGDAAKVAVDNSAVNGVLLSFMERKTICNAAIRDADPQLQIMNQMYRTMKCVSDEREKKMVSIIDYLLVHLNCQIDEFLVSVKDADDLERLAMRKYPAKTVMIEFGSLQAVEMSLLWQWAPCSEHFRLTSRLPYDYILNRRITVKKLEVLGMWLTRTSLLELDSEQVSIVLKDFYNEPATCRSLLGNADLNAYIRQWYSDATSKLQHICIEFNHLDEPLDMGLLTRDIPTLPGAAKTVEAQHELLPLFDYDCLAQGMDIPMRNGKLATVAIELNNPGAPEDRRMRFHLIVWQCANPNVQGIEGTL